LLGAFAPRNGSRLARADALDFSQRSRGPTPLVSLAPSLEPQALRSGVSRTERHSPDGR